MLLYRKTFTHKHFYTKRLLHTDPFTAEKGFDGKLAAKQPVGTERGGSCQASKMLIDGTE